MPFKKGPLGPKPYLGDEISKFHLLKSLIRNWRTERTNSNILGIENLFRFAFVRIEHSNQTNKWIFVFNFNTHWIPTTVIMICDRNEKDFNLLWNDRQFLGISESNRSAVIILLISIEFSIFKIKICSERYFFDKITRGNHGNKLMLFQKLRNSSFKLIFQISSRIL